MNEITVLLKKFKHLLVPLALVVVFYYVISSFWAKDEGVRNAALAENAARQKVLELALQKKNVSDAISRSTGLLYKGDYNDFMNMISDYASDSRLSILSSRKADMKSSGGGKGDDVFRDFGVDLSVEGSYESILSFVSKIDAVKEYVVVTVVALRANESGAQTVRADIELVAKALGKIQV